MTKPAITKRSVKGAALTYNELDTNFQNLADATLTLTAGTGGTAVTADLNGNITLVAGTNVTITGDNTAKTITINSSGGSGTNASTITLANATQDTNQHYLSMSEAGATGNQALYTDLQLYYYPSTNALYVGGKVTTGEIGSNTSVGSGERITIGASDISVVSSDFRIRSGSSSSDYLRFYPGTSANSYEGFIDGAPDHDMAIRVFNSSGQVESSIGLDPHGLGMTLGASYAGSSSGSITFSDGVTRHVGITTTQRNNISSPAEGMMIYNSSTDTFQGYANGSWVTLSSALLTIPAFRAYPTSAQTITSGSLQKCNFGSESFDTNNNFASSRFTPTVAGYYQLNSTVRFDGANGTGECMIVIYKNGSEYARGWNSQGTQFAANFWSMSVSDIAYANGSTDYFEIYIQQGSGSDRTTTAYGNISFFSGCLIKAD